MKIIVTCRVRDEESNIERFCLSYQWADKILIADGGSKDKTIEIAQSLPKTDVRKFDQYVCNVGPVWRNPHGKMMNFLFDWAKEEKADWIIFDDCDCVPSQSLGEAASEWLRQEEYKPEVILAYRMYIRGQNYWYPDMNKPGQSLWAWRSSVPIRASEVDPWKHEITGIDKGQPVKYDYPLSLLHYFYPDEITMQRKLNFYQATKEIDGVQHPDKYAGRIDELPGWAVPWKPK